MAREDQAHSMPGSERDDTRIVSEQDGSSIARNTAHRAADIGAIPVIIHSGHIQGGAAKLYCNMLITKDIYATLPQCYGDRVRPHPEIVVAKHGEDSVACAQAAQDFRGRFDIRA